VTYKFNHKKIKLFEKGDLISLCLVKQTMFFTKRKIDKQTKNQPNSKAHPIA
jgi:hypothetical protein